ncbi:MAG: serine/threonine-protein kinase [Candidatus Eisenbacteria bacterium]
MAELDPERFQRVRHLILEIAQLSEDEREQRLEALALLHPDTLNEALDLLAHEGKFDPRRVLAVSARRLLPETGIDDELGPYKLLRLIGEGGMGAVYLAEQREPIRRRVAVKVIKWGMDTKRVLARFESERQALALMDHPNIATVLDAGNTQAGRPFFVMEYVDGTPITEYADENCLAIDERLNLFTQVCAGVQHAHQKGIIHRDLKPSNILVALVDGRPTPKIIDFGVAKATGQQLTEETVFTELGVLIGTPEYMSPEQTGMSGLDVDTRTDVYALGSILYEMLVGVLPLDPVDLRKAGLAEIHRMIREAQPVKPSTRIQSLGDSATEAVSRRRTDLPGLRRKLRDDLDWIVMKALEKDRTRRFDTPKDMADDIERYLRHDPVVARPPSTTYLLSRFVRRNRAGVAVAAVALLGIVGFGIWQTVQNQIIAAERDRAMANERLSLAREQIEKDPTVAIAYALSSLEILDQGATRDVVRRALIAGPVRDELPRRDGTWNPLSVDASDDGKMCAVAWTGAENPQVGIYSLDDLSMRTLDGTGLGFTYTVRFTAGSQYIVAAATNGVHLYRVSDGAHLLHELSEDSKPNIDVLPTEDPRRVLVTATAGGERPEWYALDVESLDFTPLGSSLGLHSIDQRAYQGAADGRGERIVEYADRDVFVQRLDELSIGRIEFVGRHDDPIACVGCDRNLERAVSVDVGGVVRVWDVRSQPARLIRQFAGDADVTWIRVDPYRPDVFTTYRSGLARLYDLSTTPPRKGRVLPDRSHWTHEGTFLPDGTLITTRNGLVVGPVAHWRVKPVVDWYLDLPDSLGTPAQRPIPAPDGSSMIYWTGNGNVVRVPSSDPNAVPEIIARTPAVTGGMWVNLKGSEDQSRLLTDNSGLIAMQGAHVIDTDSGRTRQIDIFTNAHVMRGISPSGDLACFWDVGDGYGEDNLLRIVDLDSLRVVKELNAARDDVLTADFRKDGSLVYLTGHAVVRVDPRPRQTRGGGDPVDSVGPEAPPDTLWKGPIEAGALLDWGRKLLAVDGEGVLSWVDLDSGETIPLGAAGSGSIAASYEPSLGLLAVSGWWPHFRVFDLREGRSWTVPIPSGERSSVTTIDPVGRWIVVRSGTTFAVRLPLDPIFEDLETEDFVSRIRELTNVRVTPDPSESGRFTITNTNERVE